VQCTKQCGGGTRHRKIVCVHMKSMQSVGEELCSSHVKPREEEPCETDPCLPWSVNPWQPVSVVIVNIAFMSIYNLQSDDSINCSYLTIPLIVLI